jgi:hypothetical protein
MTDKIITPEEFLAEEQRMMHEFWNKFHSIMAQFSILRNSGKIEHFIVESLPNDSAKEKFYAFQRKVCKQPNIVCAIRIQEMWASIGQGAKRAVRPSQDPNRKTGVLVSFFTPTDEKTIMYLEEDGKLVQYDKEGEGTTRIKYGNPFKNQINLKDKNYN